MSIWTFERTPVSFPQQGRSIGWIAWALLTLLSFFGLAHVALANTPAPGQTTFAAVTVGQTSAPVLVTLTVQTAGTPAAPVATTEGVSTANLAEFSITDPGTCGSSGTLSAQQTCTVTATFSPRFPGVRHGAILVETSNGTLLASGLVSGIGQGGLPVLIPGEINTVAGDGQWFYQGDNVPATQAPIYLPSALAVDGAGNLFLADTINNRIRRVDAVTHTITTVAGNGTAGFSGDGGPATAAEIFNPSGLALDGAGNLFIADTGSNTIRRVDAISGIISTIAGTPGNSGYTGDGGPAANARLNAPQGIALTPSGDVLIADTNNAVIRVVTASDGTISTIAGTGNPGYNGDNILATSAQLNDPSGIALRSDGTIAIADLSNNRVRLFTVGGNITTVAGTGSGGYTGDGGEAQMAELQGPAAVAFDPAGDLLIADSVNNCIRMVYGAQNLITTLAGTPTDDRYAGDGGPDNAARMHGPDGLVFDAAGNLWLSDRFNNRVREVSGSTLTIGPYPTMKVGKTSQPVAEQLMNAGNQSLNLATPILQQAKLDPNSTTCGQSALSPAVLCQMGIEFAPQNVGANITGSVTWNSDAPNVTPTDQLYGQVLSVEPTSVAITSSANPGLIGQPVTLTATVTSDDTGRTGTVDFVEGGTTWCSAVPLAADGTAVCQIPSLSLGNHNFIANYSGDSNNAASQSSTFQETIKQQAALALGVSSSPATVTSNITLSVSASDASGTPTGTAIFYDGTTPLATVTLDANGNGSWSTSSFTIGTHTLSAQYSGDSSNVAGTTPATTLVINQAATVTVLSSSNNDATVGSSITLSTNVVSNNGPTPTGNVQFLDGTTVLGSSPLNNSSATLPISNITPGSHALSAVYSGDTDNATSTSAILAQKIEQIGTVTTLGADVDPANAGATVTFTAIVTVAPGAVADGAVSGTITFHDGNSVLGSAPISGTGQAVLPVKTLNVGSHSIVATYSGNTNYAVSNSTTITEAVQQTPTSITLSSASSITLMGEPASFTASVTNATGIPTGNVMFKDGATVLGASALDGRGSASFSTSTLGIGRHSITALYSGDANYLAATSTALQQTVNLAQAVLLLSGPSGAVDAGTTAKFVVSLSSLGAAPTGSLVLLDGSTVLGTQTVSNAGSFTFATTTLPVGTHTLTASYSGDTNNTPAISTAIAVVVRQAATTTVLAASANPLTQGNPLTLTASVSTESPSPSGTISFFDGSTQLGTSDLASNGTATLQVPNLFLGSHPLTATYLGDTNHAGSASIAIPELVVQGSSVSLRASLNPAITGQNVVFSGQINGYPTPTGTAIFRDNGLTLGTVQLNGAGIATLQTSSLSVGTHTITLTYSGDNNFSAANTQIAEVILNATTQTILSAGANPATYGQPLAISASVDSNGGAATGTVTFFDSGSAVGSAVLDSNGTASLTRSNLSPGTHTLSAAYGGDGKANPSSSKPLSVVVKQITELAVSSDANPNLTLTPVNLVATLISPGAAVPTGTITFLDGDTVLGAATVDSAGHSSLSLPQLTAGTHAITATYAGDGEDFASTSPAYGQVIQLRPTATTVTGTATDPSNPQEMTLIAVVKGGGSAPPSGTVNFTSGNITLGAASVDPTGVATITVIFNTPTQQIVASYGGDISYSASQSASTAITAGQPAQFTVALSTPTVTLVSHQHASVTVTVASVKGFTDNIALGCLGLPYAATCTFDTSQLKLAAYGSATTTLVIDTGDPLGAGSSASAVPRANSRVSGVFTCFLPAAVLLTGLFRRSRRAATALLSCLLLIALATGLTGCSGLQMSGTPPGTYTVRVIGTGQGSNTTQAQTITLVVTQ